MGEPFRTLFEAQELAAMLAGLGFETVTFLTPEAARTYLGSRRDALQVPARLHVAAAIVGAGKALSGATR